jgi:elongator complex protein 2
LLPYELLHATNKKDSIHTRIIWSCSWSNDSKYFVSGSREGKVVVWKVEGGVQPIGEQLTLKQAATALDFLQLPNESYIIAVGCENGTIFLYQWSPNDTNWIELISLNQK